MLITVTQVLPSGHTQKTKVNPDLIEVVFPYATRFGAHFTIGMQSGREIEIEETDVEALCGK